MKSCTKSKIPTLIAYIYIPIDQSIICSKLELMKQLPNKVSIYSTDVLTIDLSLDIITLNNHVKLLIDSTSVFMSLKNKKNSRPTDYNTIEQNHRHHVKNKDFLFCCKPSHIVI